MRNDTKIKFILKKHTLTMSYDGGLIGCILENKISRISTNFSAKNMTDVAKEGMKIINSGDLE